MPNAADSKLGAEHASEQVPMRMAGDRYPLLMPRANSIDTDLTHFGRMADTRHMASMTCEQAYNKEPRNKDPTDAPEML